MGYYESYEKEMTVWEFIKWLLFRVEPKRFGK